MSSDDGPINGAGFLAYVERQLVPTLEPGDIVISGHFFELTEWTAPEAPGETAFRGNFIQALR